MWTTDWLENSLRSAENFRTIWTASTLPYNPEAVESGSRETMPEQFLCSCTAHGILGSHTFALKTV